MASTSASFEECAVCQKLFPSETISEHVIQCFEVQSQKFSSQSSPANNKKRQISDLGADKTYGIFNCTKKVKVEEKVKVELKQEAKPKASFKSFSPESHPDEPPKPIKPRPEPPLSDAIRAESFDDYVGQKQAVGENSIIRNLLKSNNIPSMIFWGPPGRNREMEEQRWINAEVGKFYFHIQLITALIQ